ncbi:ABC transporter ATP-binding protein, partial [Candidatus Gracilibacteria bacterium]|nr:ABC transporter ATP-binding protein [Candidatus Gracilibacteria bacterium]
GGEKQRLALARGIFAAEDSTIVLLDEPTSSVDSRNELKIHKNLFAKFKDKCLVSSIHRLHLLNLFDYIYIFSKGEIVEEGTYKTLSQKGTHLSEMMRDYHEE